MYGKNSSKYSQAVRKFAITSHFYSPRCYGFFRQKFNLHLPNISTIRKWYARCSAHGEPGISADGLDAIKKLNQIQVEKDEKLHISIAQDEMSMRKHIQWSDSRKQFMGYISHGIRIEHKNDIPVARNVLVFLVSGINVDFHMPIAYYFVTALNSTERAELISQVIAAVSSTGVKVVSLTFDGLSSNFSASEKLGASFNLKNMKPYISSPIDNSNIYILPDVCHMFKLVRNFIASEKVFHNGLGETIEWRFFENLEKHRESNNLVTHKLTKRHIQWDRAQMDVRLATQTLSNSVAESLEYLSRNGAQGFENCLPTAEFARKFNDLFDVLNTKRKRSERFYKNPITKENNKEIFTFFDEMAQYIKSLSLEGVDILKTRKRTGFKGFIICMMNVKNIFIDYVQCGHFDEIPTFNLSQDPLESLFSRVRYLNGNNDNPTAEQFISCMRKLLIQSEFSSSNSANCRDDLNILVVPSTSIVPNTSEKKKMMKYWISKWKRSIK